MGCDNNITDKCKLVKRDGTEYYLIDRMDEVREEMLNLLRIVDDICNKENLKYWIDGGSMIGAIRHGGFIPWDDDIDIAILKKDYLKLVDALEKYCATSKDCYLLYSGENRYKHCCNYLCSTKNLYTRWSKESAAIFPIKLDIAPVNVIMSDATSVQLNAELRGIANMHLTGESKCEFSELSEKYRKMSPRDFFKFYNDEYGCEELNENTLITAQSNFYKSPAIKHDFLHGFKRIDFSGIKTWVPAGYDYYLKSIYGDYMQLPPLENRAPAAYEYISIKNQPKNLKEIPFWGEKAPLIKLVGYIRMFGIKKFATISSIRILNIINGHS